ncbi:hypothetical protein N0V88_006009 [Collariella sp. IMI 366227]|nr:hypothetical protein N0V88_006009 [Collariella sp. IMI 366227]
MLAHQCSPRASLLLLVVFLVFIFALTANRLHNGSPSSVLDHRPDDAGKNNGQKHQSDKAKKPAHVYPPILETDSDFCKQDLNFLRHKDLDLTENILYTRRCVRPSRSESIDRDIVANITDSLITGFTHVDLRSPCAAIIPPACEPLRAQLIAIVSDADDPELDLDLPALEAAYRRAGMLATITAPKLKQGLPRKDTPPKVKPESPAPVEQLHFLLVRDMLDAATPQTTWLGVLDDDTFFPALYPIVEELRKHDHTRPQWLGQLADNWVSNKLWGYMAYGGAGVFLSMPLAKQLEPHLEECVTETTIVSGDGMLKECVYGYSTAKLTLVDGLWQHDIKGDPSGFFESGRKTLSIHHWKSWYHAPVDKMAGIARFCGDCFLQRWRFGEDTLFVNGYSITTYRDGLEEVDLERVEGTFDEVDDRYDFVYQPFRKRLGADEKKSYRLVAVDNGVFRGEGKFRQVYVYRSPERDGGGKGLDEVVELVWEF